jgi:hypothetical protein
MHLALPVLEQEQPGSNHDTDNGNPSVCELRHNELSEFIGSPIFQGRPFWRRTPTSGFQTVSQIEQSLVSPYLPPGIPGDLVALGNVSISQSPINNGFQGHMLINALSEFADCLIRKEQLSQSIQILDRGSQLHPNSVQLKYNLAIAQLRSHHPVEAIRSCRL